MEKSGISQYSKYYEVFDILVTADNCCLRVDFRVFKRLSQESSKQFTMAGQIKAFELIPAKSTINESYWLSMVLDLTEPTYYLWNFEIKPNSDSLKEISKIELGHYSFEMLCCSSSDLNLKLYAVSPNLLLEITLPDITSNKYILKEISDKPNPHCVFDAMGSKLVVPSDTGYEVVSTDTGTSKHLWGKDVLMIKFSKNGQKVAVALEGVLFCSPRANK